jgi:hypothetical protein
MELTTAWVNYVNRLSAIDQTATDKVGTFLTEFNRLGASDFDYGNPKHMQALINYAYGVSTTYGEAAAALACEMYDAVGLASGVFVESAVPVDPPNIKDVAATIIDAAGARNNNIVASRVGRMVKKNGIDTVVQNAKRDGAEVAWVPRGDSCAFCITLASRGWQNANYYVEHIHSNCDCTLATRFNSSTSIKGYDPRKYEDMYYGADLDGERATAKNRINALRREFYAKNKEEINAQKRMNYAERKERLNSSEAEEINVN